MHQTYEVLLCYSEKGSPTIDDKKILKELERFHVIIKEAEYKQRRKTIECSFIYTKSKMLAKRIEKDLAWLKPERLQRKVMLKGKVIELLIKKNFDPVISSLSRAKIFVIRTDQ